MFASEKQNATFQFSKESLKFLLVTYHKFLKPGDFININEVTNKVDKNNNKNTTLLTCGSILTEYYKDMKKVISNLQHTEQFDIEALKLIVNYKLICRVYFIQ